MFFVDFFFDGKTKRTLLLFPPKLFCRLAVLKLLEQITVIYEAKANKPLSLKCGNVNRTYSIVSVQLINYDVVHEKRNIYNYK